MFSVPVRRPRDVRFSVPFLSFRLQAECFLLASNLSIWSFPALPIAFPNTFEFYWITAVYTQTQNNTTRMKRRRKKPIQPQTTPFPLRVIANLLIVMSVSGENCFKCFFLRARPIPLPLVLSYYVRGLNLMPCARRICHNTALTAKHGNVINDTYHFVGQYRHMPVLYRPLHCHRFLTNPLLFIIEQWFWYSVVLSKLLAAFWNC